ncbi:MAG: biotin-dependent carboxyltransferase [Acidobacteria bacterium]|nr:biotin-dependent carboxyltransferase [Acidobacteriota bacterium]
MSLLIRKPGIRTVVRDLGRFGRMALGINPTGAMDTLSVRIVNILLSNSENAAVLDFGFPAPEIEFETDAIFCIGGCDVEAAVNGSTIKAWQPQSASVGDVLTFSGAASGNFGYLAVSGGIDLPEILGSRTTNVAAQFGGFNGRSLAAGDRLAIGETNETFHDAFSALGNSLRPRLTDPVRIRITAGPEFHRLTGLSEQVLASEPFAITPNSDPMGFRLSGPKLFSLDDTELLSSAAVFGTVQLLPDGGLAVLMSDHQTTGGYPRIATVAAVDLPLLAQLRPGRSFKFELIELGDAMQSLAEQERDLLFLETGVRLAREQVC